MRAGGSTALVLAGVDRLRADLDSSLLVHLAGCDDGIVGVKPVLGRAQCLANLLYELR